jgi:hypothetical protein
MGWAALAGGLLGGVAVLFMGAWPISLVALAIGLAFAALFRRVGAAFQPLPAELLQTGRVVPAVVVSAMPWGPVLSAVGFGAGRSARKARYEIELRPTGAASYRVVLTTFDGPDPHGLDGRELTVHVDPTDPHRIHPDWRPLEPI